MHKLRKLEERFGVRPEQIRYTPKHGYPIVLRGGDESSLLPVVDAAHAIREAVDYDVIVVGSGLAGLTSALYLSEQGKKILILERDAALGGLAAGGRRAGVSYARGGAYWTGVSEPELRILEHAGITDYKKRFAIPEPIDSYLWNGRCYLRVWSDEALQELPQSFRLFKHVIERLHAAVPIQPLELARTKLAVELDTISAAEFIDRMPVQAARLNDARTRGVYRRFLADERLDGADPMAEVRRFLDLYCRSALGTNADQISAPGVPELLYLGDRDPLRRLARHRRDLRRHGRQARGPWEPRPDEDRGAGGEDRPSRRLGGGALRRGRTDPLGPRQGRGLRRADRPLAPGDRGLRADRPEAGGGRIEDPIYELRRPQRVRRGPPVARHLRSLAARGGLLGARSHRRHHRPLDGSEDPRLRRDAGLRAPSRR